MHHELFFALLGHTGDLIVAREDGFFVRSEVAFVSAPQKCIVDRLLQVGFAFASLERFTHTALNLPSVYVRGLAQGVERVLEAYTDAIMRLEHKILATRFAFPIPQMMYELEDFIEVLPELAKLVGKIQGGDRRDTGNTQCLRGAALLELVHRMTGSGFPRLRARMLELQQCCHRILFKQVVSWLLYGDVVDPYSEFFIRRHDTDADDEPVGDAASQSIDAQIWQTRFAIDLEAVPITYFPIPVAESILFVGKAIRILARANGFLPEEAHQVVTAMSLVSSSAEFSAAALDHAVEKIRRHVAGRLYEEIVVKADFVEQLKLLKDVFLLARGELFQSLIERSESLMAEKPGHKSNDQMQQSVWLQILRDFQLDDDPWMNQFKLHIPLQYVRCLNFMVTDGLVLANMKRDASGKCIEVKDATQLCGAVWWEHSQLADNSFVSELVVDVTQTNQNGMAGKVAMLLSKDLSFVAPSVSSGYLVCGGKQQPRAFVSLELEFRPRSPDGSTCLVTSRVITATPGEQDQLLESTPQSVIIADNVVSVVLQYARVPTQGATSSSLSFAKVLSVIVNDHTLLETRLDLFKPLSIAGATSEHVVGIAVTPLLRLKSWKVEKFAAQASANPGRSLRASNETLSARDLWNFLTMRWELKWPLQLLVSTSLLRSYGQLFHFCFRLKRAAHTLERTWKCDSLRNRSSHATVVACVLRGRMGFVLRNLELYFQVFVVESAFSKCIVDIEAATDFDRVKRLHEQFVAHLVKHFYLQSRVLAGALDEVLRCCWDFAEYVLYQEGVGSAELSRDRVVHLAEQFGDKFHCLLSMLRSLDARSLLLLLDYNDHSSQLLTRDGSVHAARAKTSEVNATILNELL